ncbi:MAG: cysteine desulfurase family protein [Acetanaerobacterium sp.]
MEIYLDNSATTAVSQEVAQVVYDVMTTKYGNPSSLHGKGLEAELVLKSAREQVAKGLGVLPETVFFTSGGTEGNNLALFSAAAKGRRPGAKARIVATAFEHPSVLEPLRRLEEQGFELVLLCPDKQGNIRPEAIAEQVDENTVLVSAMAVNNEFGSVLDVMEIAKAVKRKNPNVLVHCDAVQAFCKLPLRFGYSYIDLVTVSGHKLHAPKGVGALYINKRVKLSPRVFGGAQESGMRAGTEAAALIAGFGEAVRHALQIHNESTAQMMALNTQLRGELAGLEGVVINSPDDALPYILNLSVPGVPSEVMMRFLEERKIYVSSGSACGRGKKSYALRSAELAPDIVSSALRVSPCRYNTIEEITLFVQALGDGIKALKRS